MMYNRELKTQTCWVKNILSGIQTMSYSKIVGYYGVLAYE